MGSIKLHMEPIINTISNVTQSISQINASFIQNLLTFITICCNSTTARYTGEERPRVKVTQRDIEMSFLYDTGAQRSCMPFKAFKRIYGSTNVKKINANLNIRDAGGNDLGYKGTYLLPIQLMGKRIMHDMVILENLQDNIIGIDCIHKHFLGYSSVRQSPIWETPPIDSGTLKTTERVFVDALSSRVIKVKCQDVQGQNFGQNTSMIATIDTPHTLLTGPPGLIKFNNEGIAFTVLQNCGPFGIWIERDTPIGFADEMAAQDKLEKLDRKFVSAMTNQINISAISENKRRVHRNRN